MNPFKSGKAPGTPHSKSYLDDLSKRLDDHILRKERMVTEAKVFYEKLQKQDFSMTVLLKQQEVIDEAEETLARFLRHRETFDEEVAILMPS